MSIGIIAYSKRYFQIKTPKALHIVNIHPTQANPTYFANNQPANPREVAPTTPPTTAPPTNATTSPPPATTANGSVSDAIFRNTGATLKGATLGFADLALEPIRKTWNYAKEGTTQTLLVTGGAVALGYGIVAAASAGTLFPLLAGGLALGAGIQLFRGGYGAFSAESPKEQLKGFNRLGQALTLSTLAGAAILHYKHFWHAPAWNDLFQKLGGGISESASKGVKFLKGTPKHMQTLGSKIQTMGGDLKSKTVSFWKKIVTPEQMP